MRSTGLDIIGDVPWGTHFCQFYQDKQDLLDLLVPYFTAGLEHNEFCMWVTSEPLLAEEATAAMRAAVPNFDDCLQRDQIRILDYREWYLQNGTFDAARVLQGWVEELDAARARGLEGLRLTGNTFWLEQATWRDFTEYEAAVDSVIHQYSMLAMCTYSLARCGAAEIMDVMSNHAFALIKRGDAWQVIESAERKKFEESLRVSEERYRLLFNGMTQGFALHEVVCDAQGKPCDYRFLEINPAFERLTGLERSRVVGRLVTEVLPGEDPAWIERYGNVALTGEPVHFSNYAPTLQRHYDVFAYCPSPGQFGVVFHDVTELKEAEARLVEANRLKDEFLANLSHELRTPLSAILGWADLLNRNQLDAATTRRALDTIARNAKAQAQLVSDVLDVSRIVAGRMRLCPQQVDLAAILQGAVDVVRPAANGKRITIDADLAGTVATVTADPDRLQQVFWNLLSNAVKFTPAGGHIGVALERVESFLQVTVRDSGIGIDAAFLPCVFDRFRQADSSTSRQHPGLGLGLAIARDLIELHGGTVHAASDGEGRGAAFTVRLPVRAVLQAPAGERDLPGSNGPASTVDPLSPARDALRGVSVVAVDDEADARDLIQSVLEQHGAEVRMAASVAEALEILSQRTPHVLVADVGMPGADGYELVRCLRATADARLASLPAVALTAYGRDEDRARAFAAGFQQHVAKPVLPETLVSVVAAIVGLRTSVL
jgi:PAS domain S-box-containing protein